MMTMIKYTDKKTLMATWGLLLFVLLFLLARLRSFLFFFVECVEISSSPTEAGEDVGALQFV